MVVFKDGRLVAEGRGENVGGPLRALTWVANELATYAGGLSAGDLVITGTCIEPVAIAPGERLRVDFGDLGAIEAAFPGLPWADTSSNATGEGEKGRRRLLLTALFDRATRCRDRVPPLLPYSCCV